MELDIFDCDVIENGCKNRHLRDFAIVLKKEDPPRIRIDSNTSHVFDGLSRITHWAITRLQVAVP